jgi:hypothetical protein
MMKGCHTGYSSWPQPDRSTPTIDTLLMAMRARNKACSLLWLLLIGHEHADTLSDQSLHARLCSPGYCEGTMNSQWNSLITVLVPSQRRVAGGGLIVASQCSYLDRSIHQLLQRQSSRSKCGVAATYRPFHPARTSQCPLTG